MSSHSYRAEHGGTSQRVLFPAPKGCYREYQSSLFTEGDTNFGMFPLLLLFTPCFASAFEGVLFTTNANSV